MKQHLRRWGAIYILIILFLGSWLGQFLTQLSVEKADAVEHGQSFEWPAFLHQFLASTFENWQSEFLQLLWQVVGLTWLLYVGSPQSKESEDKTEAILEEILRKVDPKGAAATISKLDQKYPSE
jgi:NTP pyrophosphatase (non-canonical NTP hydrolase)